MADVIVMPKKTTRRSDGGSGVCREYYRTDKITFGMSELPPGWWRGGSGPQRSARGILLCAGRCAVYVSQDNRYYRLTAGPPC
jgi:hypothetical protein